MISVVIPTYNEEKYLEKFHAFSDEYQQLNLWKKYESLSESERKDPAIISALRQLDVNVNINWPLVHYRTAVRYMGAENDGDEKGTGGTNWKKYLPPRFQRRIYYPSLWSAQELEEWGKHWVEEVLADSVRTGNLREEL